MRISDWSSDVCSSDLVNLTASTIFGKKAAGGASALSPSEARTVLGLATTDSPHFAGGFLDAGGILQFYHSDGTRYGEAFSDSGGFNILARSTGDDLFLGRSEEHTSELQSLMRISYAVFCFNKKIKIIRI